MEFNNNRASTTEQTLNVSDLSDALPDLTKKSTTRKKRLLVGEAHNDSDNEETSDDDEISEESEEIKTRMENFKKITNLSVEFGIDATKLHLHYKGQLFHRIYFNFPYTTQYETADMLRNFFTSAAKVQKFGHLILLTLVYKPHEDYNPEQKVGGRKFWHGYVYGIVDASEAGGYLLIGKREFSCPGKGHRYPGYKHSQTNRSTSSRSAENARQYVFERNGPKVKTGTVRGTTVRYFTDTKIDVQTSTDDEP
ncbi:unnamed protein product [Rotaria socialis]|uniref:25S rRNA (uridine-N(3))-methyltransferase BMT5-like domain-containing protein n=1 Tax=Rotaria socialis TaxID=392032 RepID=A0A817SS06_9BILA|nr:unnamed protein product [Rotaria socialis]CAF3418443.1 unnamed protein product [Rotaria socialis]CAF3682635.1 unnamed protein product [Rotaria socialis]